MNDKLKNLIDQWVSTILKKTKSTQDVSIYDVLDEIQKESFIEEKKEDLWSLNDQVKGYIKPSKKTPEYILYIVSNFIYKLYKFSYKDYKNNKIIKGTIRGLNKIEAWVNAKKVYLLNDIPDQVTEIEISDDRLKDKFKVNPTFFFKKKISKKELAEFLIEYSSLMEDGLNRKDALELLKDLITDSELLDFLEFLKSSNLSLSGSMRKSKAFDDYTIQIVESAEQSGWDTKLYQWLRALWESYRDEEQFKSKFIKSLIYPWVLVTFILLIVIWVVFFVAPILAWLFWELRGWKALPGTLLMLLSLKQNIVSILLKWGSVIAVIILLKRILFSNSFIRGLWNQLKLRIPVIWDLFRILEENRFFRILIQTKTSNLSEVEKLKSLERSTNNELYKWVYRYMWNKYSWIRDLNRTIIEANEKFWWRIFSKRMILVLNLARWETDKVLQKYRTFLNKNTEELYEKLKKLNLFVTTFATMIVASLIVWIFTLVFWLIFSLTS